MSEHSLLPPSSAARRRQCPQSTTWEASYPEAEDSPEAAEGTAVHWAGAEQLHGRLVDVGVIAPNGVALTEEMVDAADLYSDAIHKMLAPYGLKPSDGRIEERVAIPRVHPESWGTPDFWVFVPQINTYIVADLKYGHRYVEVAENAQLTEYSAGVTHGAPESARVRFVVVQPRSYHRDGPVRTWETTLLDLRASINLSSNAAHEALGPQPRVRTGPECRDCKARHACPALQSEGYRAADAARGVTPLELTPAALALEARMLTEASALLKARLTGLEAQMQALLKQGQYVPGWGIEHGVGRERWTRPVEEIVALGKMMGVSLSKPDMTITPAQARKAGLPAELVAAFSERPRGEAKLVMVDTSAVARVFRQGAA